MITLKKKFRYFLDSLFKTAIGRGSACPSCGHAEAAVVARKYGVNRLLRCGACKLLYRAPTTTEEEYKYYYQDEYSEGFTTDLPSADKLEEMKRVNFVGTGKDYSKYIEILRALGGKDGDDLLDFGCSWGYGSWQFSRAGFSVKSFEISQPRREFAKNHLGVEVYSEISEIDAQFDIFFSSHVLEHIPKLSEVFALARKVVRPGGWFVAFTPNGSSAYQNINPTGWSKSWGFVHPLVLDDVFYQSFFKGSRYLIDSSPYVVSDISAWASEHGETMVLRLDGSELLIAVRF